MDELEEETTTPPMFDSIPNRVILNSPPSLDFTDRHHTPLYFDPRLRRSMIRDANLGDSEINVGVGSRKSFGETKNGNWGKLGDAIINWIPTIGQQSIASGRLSIANTAVTPGEGGDYSPPLKVADQTSGLLIERLPKIAGRIGIEVDNVQSGISTVIVNHNLQ